MTAPPTIDAALAAATRDGIERLDAQLLLGHVLRRPRTWLLAHGEAPLTSADADAWVDLSARRAAGVPLAYLLGEKEFHGLALTMTPAVLVPRPDTEVLVAWGLDLLDGPLAAVAGPRVVDLGTGSGAVALAIKARAPHADVVGLDCSAAALDVARINTDRCGLSMHWIESDWWQDLGGPPVDLALANPPYIADGDPHLPALRFEPSLALVSGPDGLDALRRIVSGANAHLAADGWLLLEHGHDQADAVCALLRQQGFRDVASRTDLGGHRRCSGGRRGLCATDSG